MWTESSTFSSGEFRLLCLSDAEYRLFCKGGDVVFCRLEYLDYTGDIVLCYGGETCFMAFMCRAELVVGKKGDVYRYRFKDVRRCIEFPCPELGTGVELWHYEPKEALIPYPETLKRNYAANSRLGRWRVRWLRFMLYFVFVLVSILFGLLMWSLCAWSPLFGGLLFGGLLFYLLHKAALLSL